MVRLEHGRTNGSGEKISDMHTPASSYSSKTKQDTCLPNCLDMSKGHFEKPDFIEENYDEKNLTTLHFAVVEV